MADRIPRIIGTQINKIEENIFKKFNKIEIMHIEIR